MLGNRWFRTFFLTTLFAAGVFGSKATAQAKWSACKPVESATFVERIHVRCDTPVDTKFFFFSASTQDSKFSARALSVIEAGQLSGKFIRVLFDPNDQSGNDFGCLVTDCRRMTAVVLIDTTPDKCEIDSTQKGCPGYCAANGANDSSCPQFCTSNPNRPPCSAFCQSHDDMLCTGNCSRHPTNAACKTNSDECFNQHLPGCQDH